MSNSLQVSAFDSITLVQDGDQIAAALFPTKPLKQYVKLGTDYVYPNWTDKEEQPVIYPRIQSQNTGLRMEVISGTEKWFHNDKEIKFDSTGLSEDKRFKKKMFQDGVVQVPSLRIVGNLASPGNTSPDKLDFIGEVKVGMNKVAVTPSISIGLEEVAGDPYDSFIATTNGGVIDNVTDSVVCTAYLRKGGNKVTEGVTYKWYKDTSNGYVEINADSDKANTKTIKADDISTTLVLKVDSIIGGEIVSTTSIQLYDETDPLIINRRPTGPLQLTNGGSVTFKPVVMRRDKEIAIPGYTFKYLLYNIESTLMETRSGDTCTITSGDVMACKGNVRLHTHAIKE